MVNIRDNQFLIEPAYLSFTLTGLFSSCPFGNISSLDEKSGSILPIDDELLVGELSLQRYYVYSGAQCVYKYSNMYGFKYSSVNIT